MSNKSHFFRQSNGDAFIATFRTTSANESITLPYLSNGTYSGTIDFGDGTVVANTYANRTHTYVNSGDYDVEILGECVGWTFQGNPDFAKIINVSQWGNGLRTSDSAFVACPNLDVTATDTLDFSGVTTLRRFFIYCSSLVFNSSVSNWDISNISSLVDMFREAGLFNQDISTWDFSNTSSLRGFMQGKSSANYNAEYYDNLLIKWASDPSLGGLQPNIIGTIDMGSIKYTANGASARASILANNKAQVINDGGQI